MRTLQATVNTGGRYVTARTVAVNQANEEDGKLWRWFCLLYEERRIRWCEASEGWLVSIDHRHVATEHDFDAAIRAAHICFLSDKRFKAKSVA